jgi:hypothetical protein
MANNYNPRLAGHKSVTRGSSLPNFNSLSCLTHRPKASTPERKINQRANNPKGGGPTPIPAPPGDTLFQSAFIANFAIRPRGLRRVPLEVDQGNVCQVNGTRHSTCLIYSDLMAVTPLSCPSADLGRRARHLNGRPLLRRPYNTSKVKQWPKGHGSNEP